MNKFNLNSRIIRRLSAVALLGMLIGIQPALACSKANWLGGNTGAGVLASGPDGPDGKPAIARYSGVCAMQTAAGSTEWVQDNSPGGIDRIRARFYVLANNTDNAVVYRGFNDGGGAIFSVNLNPANGNVRLLSISGENAICFNCANVGSWNSIEIDWNAGGGDMSISVNTEAPVSTSFTSTETVSSVRLGNLDGAGGTLNFDAYESRRSTEVGRLLACNAQNEDTAINVLDALAVINEINDAGLASGQPDCNEDGSVNVLDALDIINIINS